MALNEGQFHEIQERLSNRRFVAEKEALEKEKEVLEKLPDYAALSEELRRLSFSAVEKAREGEQGAIAALRSSIEEIRKKKELLLKKLGYRLSDLEPQYTCSLCCDTGVYEGKKCKCFLKLQGERLAQTGNKTVREYILELRDYFYTYTARYPENTGNFIFTGGTGTGKTFFLHCIAKALLDRGVSVLYFTADGLFQHFSRLMREGTEDEYIMQADVLLIDDLGTEFSNSFTASRFFNLLNRRILEKKTMMISTNLNFKDLRELYSDRVVSRMMSDYEIIPFYGRDLRLG